MVGGGSFRELLLLFIFHVVYFVLLTLLGAEIFMQCVNRKKIALAMAVMIMTGEWVVGGGR